MLSVMSKSNEPSGSYSIIIEKAEPDGEALAIPSFEQLKRNYPGRRPFFQERFKTSNPQVLQNVSGL